MKTSKLGFFSTVAFCCLLSGAISTQEKVDAQTTNSATSSTLSVYTPLTMSEVASYTFASRNLLLYNTESLGVLITNELGTYAGKLGDLLVKLDEANSFQTSPYPNTFALFYRSTDGLNPVGQNPETLTWTLSLLNEKDDIIGWQDQIVSENEQTQLYGFQTGIASDNELLTFANNIINLDLIPVAVGFRFIAQRGNYVLRHTETADTFETISYHGAVIDHNQAISASSYVRVYNILTKNFEAPFNSKANQSNAAYGTKLKFRQTGYLNYVNLGRISANVEANRAYPDHELDATYRTIMMAAAPSDEQLESKIGSITLQILANSVNIPIQEKSLFLVYSLDKIAADTNLNSNNLVETATDRGVTTALFYSLPSLIGAPSNSHDWLRTHRTSLAEDESYAVLFAKYTNSSVPVFTFSSSSVTPNQYNIFAGPVNNTEPHNYRTLFVDSAELRFSGDQPVSVYVAGDRYNVGGTIILNRSSKLRFASSNIRLVTKQLVIDATSTITFEGPGGSATAPQLVAQRTVLSETLASIPQPVDLSSLFIISSTVLGSATVARSDAYWLASLENFVVLNNFFSSDLAYPLGEQSLTLDAKDESGAVVGILLLRAFENALDVYLHTPPSLSVVDGKITLEESVITTLTATNLASLDPNNNVTIVPAATYADTSFFAGTIQDTGNLPTDFLTKVKVTAQSYLFNNFVAASNQRIDLLAITHIGSSSGWSYDLYRFNLPELTDAALTAAAGSDFTSLFSFSSDATNAVLNLNLGHSYGTVKAEVRQVSYAIQGAVFANDQLMAIHGGFAVSQEAAASDVSVLINPLLNDVTLMSDSSVALNTVFASCPAAGCLDRQATISFEKPAVIYGVIGLDVGTPTEHETVAPQLIVELGEEVGTGLSGNGHRAAFLYGHLEFSYSSNIYSAQTVEERAAVFTMQVKLADDASVTPRDLYWIQAAGQPLFLKPRYANELGVKLTQAILIGSLEIESNVNLAFTHQGLCTDKVVSLDFAQVSLASLAKLTISTRELNSNLHLAHSSTESGQVSLSTGAELIVENGVQVKTGNLDLAESSKVIIDNRVALGKLTVVGNLNLASYTSVEYVSNDSVGTHWTNCASSSLLVCADLVEASSVSLNGVNLDPTTASETYYATNYKSVTVTFNNAGDYPVAFQAVRLADLSAAENDWFKLTVETGELAPTIIIKAQPDFTTSAAVFNMLFRAENTDLIKSATAFTDPIFTFTAPAWSALNADQQQKLFSIYRGLALRSQEVNLGNDFLKITDDYFDDSLKSYALLLPLVPGGRQLSVQLALDGTSVSNNQVTLSGDFFFHINYLQTAAATTTNLHLGDLASTAPFYGAIQGTNLDQLILVAIKLGDQASYRLASQRLHRLSFTGDSPLLTFTADQNLGGYFTGNYALDLEPAASLLLSAVGTAEIVFANIDQTKPLFHQLADATPVANLSFSSAAPVTFEVNAGASYLGITNLTATQTVKFTSLATSSDSSPVLHVGGSLDLSDASLEVEGVIVHLSQLVISSSSSLVVRSATSSAAGKLVADQLILSHGEFNEASLRTIVGENASLTLEQWSVIVEANSLQQQGAELNLTTPITALSIATDNNIYLKQLQLDAATSKYLLQQKRIAVPSEHIITTSLDQQNQLVIAYQDDLALHLIQGPELDFVTLMLAAYSDRISNDLLLAASANGALISHPGETYNPEAKDLIQAILSDLVADNYNQLHPLIGLDTQSEGSHDLRGINDHVAAVDYTTWLPRYLVNHQLGDNETLELLFGENTVGTIKLTAVGSNHQVNLHLTGLHSGDLDISLNNNNLNLFIATSADMATLAGEVKLTNSAGSEINLKVIFTDNNSDFTWTGPLFDPSTEINSLEVSATGTATGSLFVTLPADAMVGNLSYLAIKAGITVVVTASEASPTSDDQRWLSKQDTNAKGEMILDYQPVYADGSFVSASHGQLQLATLGSFKADGLQVVRTGTTLPASSEAEAADLVNRKFITFAQDAKLELNYLSLPSLRNLQYLGEEDTIAKILISLPLTAGTCDLTAPVSATCVLNKEIYAAIVGDKYIEYAYREADGRAEIIFTRTTWDNNWYSFEDDGTTQELVFIRQGTKIDFVTEGLVEEIVTLIASGASLTGDVTSLMKVDGQVGLNALLPDLLQLTSAISGEAQVTNFGGHLLEVILAAGDPTFSIPAELTQTFFGNLIKFSGSLDQLTVTSAGDSLRGSLQFAVQPLTAGSKQYEVHLPQLDGDLHFLLSPETATPASEPTGDYLLPAVKATLTSVDGVISFGSGTNGLVAAHNQLLWRSLAADDYQTWSTTILFSSDQPAWLYKKLSWTISNAPVNGETGKPLLLVPQLLSENVYGLVYRTGTSSINANEDLSSVLAIATGAEGTATNHQANPFQVNLQLPNPINDQPAMVLLSSNLVLFNSDPTPLQTTLKIAASGSTTDEFTATSRLQVAGFSEAQYSNIEIHENQNLATEDAASSFAHLFIGEPSITTNYPTTLVEARNIIVATDKAVGSVQLRGSSIVSAYRFILHNGSGQLLLQDDAQLVTRYLSLSPQATDQSQTVVSFKVSAAYLASAEPRAFIHLQRNLLAPNGERFASVDESKPLAEQQVHTSNSLLAASLLNTSPLGVVAADYTAHLANLEQIAVVLPPGQQIDHRAGILLVVADQIVLHQEARTSHLTASYLGLDLTDNNYAHLQNAGYFSLLNQPDNTVKLYYNNYPTEDFAVSGIVADQFTVDLAIASLAANPAISYLFNSARLFHLDSETKSADLMILQAALDQDEAVVNLDATRPVLPGFSSLAVMTVNAEQLLTTNGFNGFAAATTSLLTLLAEQNKLKLAISNANLNFTSLYAILVEDRTEPLTVDLNSFAQAITSQGLVASFNASNLDYVAEFINLSGEAITLLVPASAPAILSEVNYLVASLASSKTTPVLSKIVVGSSYTGNLVAVGGASETYGSDTVVFALGTNNSHLSIAAAHDGSTAETNFIGNYSYTYLSDGDVNAPLAGSLQVSVSGFTTSWQGQLQLANQAGINLVGDPTAANSDVVFTPEIALANYYPTASIQFSWSVAATETQFVTGGGNGVNLIITNPVAWGASDASYTYTFNLFTTANEQAVGLKATVIAPADDYVGTRRRQLLNDDLSLTEVTKQGAHPLSQTELVLSRAPSTTEETDLCFALSCSAQDVSLGSLTIASKLTINEGVTLVTGSLDARGATLHLTVNSMAQLASIQVDSLNLTSLAKVTLELSDQFSGSVTLAEVSSEFILGGTLVTEAIRYAYQSGLLYVTDTNLAFDGTLTGSVRKLVFDRGGSFTAPDWLTIPATAEEVYAINRSLVTSDLTTAKMESVNLYLGQLITSQSTLGRDENLQATAHLMVLDYQASEVSELQTEFINKLAPLLLGRGNLSLHDNHFKSWFSLAIPNQEADEKSFTVAGLAQLAPELSDSNLRMSDFYLFSYVNPTGTGSKFTINITETGQPYQTKVQVAGEAACSWNDPQTTAKPSYVTCYLTSSSGVYRQTVTSLTTAGSLVIELPNSNVGSTTITIELADASALNSITLTELATDPGYNRDLEMHFMLSGNSSFYAQADATVLTKGRLIDKVNLSSTVNLEITNAASVASSQLNLIGVKQHNLIDVDIVKLGDGVTLSLSSDENNQAIHLYNFYLPAIEFGQASLIQINAKTKLYLTEVVNNGRILVEVGVNGWDDASDNHGVFEIAGYVESADSVETSSFASTEEEIVHYLDTLGNSGLLANEGNLLVKINPPTLPTSGETISQTIYAAEQTAGKAWFSITGKVKTPEGDFYDKQAKLVSKVEVTYDDLSKSFSYQLVEIVFTFDPSATSTDFAGEPALASGINTSLPEGTYLGYSVTLPTVPTVYSTSVAVVIGEEQVPVVAILDKAMQLEGDLIITAGTAGQRNVLKIVDDQLTFAPTARVVGLEHTNIELINQQVLTASELSTTASKLAALTLEGNNQLSAQNVAVGVITNNGENIDIQVQAGSSAFKFDLVSNDQTTTAEDKLSTFTVLGDSHALVEGQLLYSEVALAVNGNNYYVLETPKLSTGHLALSGTGGKALLVSEAILGKPNLRIVVNGSGDYLVALNGQAGSVLFDKQNYNLDFIISNTAKLVMLGYDPDDPASRFAPVIKSDGGNSVESAGQVERENFVTVTSQMVLVTKQQQFATSVGLVAVATDYYGEQFAAGDNSEARAAYYLDADQATITLVNSGTLIGGAYLKNTGDLEFSAEYNSLTSGEIIFALTSTSSTAQLTLVSGSSFRGQAVFQAAPGQVYATKVVFSASGQDPDAESTWRADLREQLAARDDLASFWTNRDPNQLVTTSSQQSLEVQSGKHSLVHGGGIATAASVTIGTSVNPAQLALRALNLGEEVTAATEFRIGGDNTTSQLTINDQGILVVGSAVNIRTNSQLVVNDGGKISYELTGGLGDYAAGHLTVERAADEDLELPGWAVFDFTFLTEDPLTFSENRHPIFSFNGGELSFADGNSEEERAQAGLKLILEANQVFLTTVTSTPPPQTPEEAEQELVKQVVTQIASAANVISSLADISVSSQSPTSAQSTTDSGDQDASEEELTLRGRAVLKDYSGSSEAIYKSAPKGSSYWIDVNASFVGFSDNNSKSKYITSLQVTGGLQFKPGFTVQVGVVGTIAHILSKGVETETWLSDVGGFVKTRIEFYKPLAVTIGVSSSFARYSYKNNNQWQASDGLGNNTRLSIGLDLGYTVSKHFALGHSILVSGGPLTLPSMIKNGDNRTRLSAELKQSNFVTASYRAGPIVITHQVELGFSAIATGDWSVPSGGDDPEWAKTSGNLMTNFTFSNGLTFGIFGNLSYLGITRDKGQLTYKVGINFMYSK